MASKTYYIADANVIKRLDNIDVPGVAPGVGAWVNVSLTTAVYGPGQPVPVLNDIKTDPTNANKVFVVGQTYILYKGIAISADGGTSGWIVPNLSVSLTTAINAIANFKWYEVWPIDSDNIVICGDNGIVAVSFDGGLNFDRVPTQVNVPALVLQDLTSIHWQKNAVGQPLFGVVGLDNFMAKTIDGGLTWSILNGGNPINPGVGQITGIYLSEDAQVIIALGHNGIVRSSDGGLTFIRVADIPMRQGRHLTWAQDPLLVTTFWATGLSALILKSTDQGLTWLPAPPPIFGDYYAAHFYTLDNGFYGITGIAQQVYYNDAISSTFSDTAPNTTKTLQAVWTSILAPTCYRITNCATGFYYRVNTDLSAYVGGIIRWSRINTDPATPVPGCWTVQIDTSCVGSFAMQVDDSYSDCSICQSRCYVLTNCADPNDYIITSNDLEIYLHKVVRLAACDNRCYFISKSGVCDDALPMAPLDSTNIFNDCETCTGTDSTDPITLNYRRIKPGYYTPGCPPKYVEKVNCKFADIIFDQVAAKRYGITICCDHDTEQWLLKKQMLDLQSLYDPTICANTIANCDAVCNVTAEINYFISTPVIVPVPPVIPCVGPGPEDPEVTFGIPPP